MRRLFLPEHTQKHTGAVEKTMRLVQMRGAHRQIPGVDLIGKRQRAFTGRGLPAVFVAFDERDFFDAAGAFRMRGDPDDIARELAHHVAARNPGRQYENLTIRVGTIDGQCDGE